MHDGHSAHQARTSKAQHACFTRHAMAAAMDVEDDTAPFVPQQPAPGAQGAQGAPVVVPDTTQVWMERRFWRVENKRPVHVDMSPLVNEIKASKTINGLKQRCKGRALLSRTLRIRQTGADGQSDSPGSRLGYAVVDAAKAIDALHAAYRSRDATTTVMLNLDDATCARLAVILRNERPEPSVPNNHPTADFADISAAMTNGQHSASLGVTIAQYIDMARRSMPAMTRGYVEGFSRRVWVSMRLLLPLQERLERVCWLLAWREIWPDKLAANWRTEEAVPNRARRMPLSDANMLLHIERFKKMAVYRETVVVAALMSLASLGIGYKVDRANRTRTMFRLPMQHQREAFGAVIANSPMRSPVHAYAILRTLVAINVVTRCTPATIPDAHDAPPEPLFDFGVFLLSRWYTELYAVLLTAAGCAHQMDTKQTRESWNTLCASLTLQWIPHSTWYFATNQFCAILPANILSILQTINTTDASGSTVFFLEPGNPCLEAFKTVHEPDRVDVLFAPIRGALVVGDINLTGDYAPKAGTLAEMTEFATRAVFAEMVNAAILVLDWIQSFVGETSGKDAIQRHTDDTWLLNRRQTTPPPYTASRTCRVCGKVTVVAKAAQGANALVEGGQEIAHYASMLDIAFERFVSAVRHTTDSQGTIERSVALEFCAGVHRVLTSYILCPFCIRTNPAPGLEGSPKPKFAMIRLFREGQQNGFPLLPREHPDGGSVSPSRVYTEQVA